MNRFLWFLLVCGVMVGGMAVVKKHTIAPPQIERILPPQIEPPPSLPKPRMPTVSVPMPNFLRYPQLVAQLDQWHTEAPDLTERGNYGQTSSNQPIHYIRVTNLLDKSPKKVVFITGCIHGNEPLSTSTLMAWVGGLLSQYGKDTTVTTLVNSRDIYFVPVVSPDSYPHSRHVDGVDPNRNFPCPARPSLRSVPPIKSIQDFFLKLKPSAAISCHTSGRACLIPWGDSMSNCPDYETYRKIVGKVCQLAQYRFMRACDMYGYYGLDVEIPEGQGYNMPIYGGELDWYYRHGAMAIVMEMGTHQVIPSPQDIKTEYGRTFQAMLYFLQEAPNVQLQQK